MKTLLITASSTQDAQRAAKVAAQIALQHHGANGLQIIHASGRQQRPRADRALHLDRFPHPAGRAVTFALREAVDALASPQPRKHKQQRNKP